MRASQEPRRRLSLALAAVLSIALGGACSKKKDPPTASPSPTVHESDVKSAARTNVDNPTPGQLARKQKSMAIIKGMKLPWLDALPVIEDDAAIKPRPGAEVATRCVATALCAIKGESNDQKLVDSLIEKYGAKTFFSPEEEAFIQNPKATQEELTNFGWRYECVHVFLWALGYLPDLSPPNRIADVEKEIGIVRDKGPENFVKDAKVRPMSEILDQNDLYYRLHWAALELRLKEQKTDAVNEEIIDERHRALNWLVRYMNQEWDEVSTDT